MNTNIAAQFHVLSSLSETTSNKQRHLLAKLLYQRGEYDSCVIVLIQSINLVYSARVVQIGMLMSLLARDSMPESCIRIIKTELGLRAEPVRELDEKSDCDLLLGYLLVLLKLSRGSDKLLPVENCKFIRPLTRFPQLTLNEQAAVICGRASRRCVRSRWCLPIKRLALIALGLAEFFFLWRISTIRVMVDYELQALGKVLHEPEKEVQRLLRLNKFYNLYNTAKEYTAERTERLTHFFRWDEKENYRHLISCDESSRVLATIHMGNVFDAFRVISALAPAGRRAISFRRTQRGRQDERIGIVATGVDHRTISDRQASPLNIVSSLRQGNTTLAILFDLTFDFGETVEVVFLGHKAQFTKGPAQLAIMARVPILPFVTYEYLGRDVI
mgnify:CR=1 FL=1